MTAQATTGSDGRIKYSLDYDLSVGLAGHGDSRGTVLVEAVWDLVSRTELGKIKEEYQDAVYRTFVSLVESVGGNLYSAIEIYAYHNHRKLQFKNYCVIKINKKHAIYKVSHNGYVKLNRLPRE